MHVIHNTRCMLHAYHVSLCSAAQACYLKPHTKLALRRHYLDHVIKKKKKTVQRKDLVVVILPDLCLKRAVVSLMICFSFAEDV